MKSSWLLLIAFSTNIALAGAHANKYLPPCISVAKVSEKTSRHRYAIEDGKFFVSAEIMPSEEGFGTAPVAGERTLMLTLELRNASGRSQLRGKEQFEKILAHFEGRFDQIAGDWMRPQEDDFSDNLDTFNQLTGEPSRLDPKKAALETWTGQRAALAGYTEVVIKRLEGSAGHYTRMQVRFRKPSI